MKGAMFCVECGAEGKVYESLCEKCFLERHKLAELPEFLDIEMCKECGNFLVGSKWIKQPLERVVDMVIDRAVSYEKIVDNAHFKVQFFPEDEMNIAIVVECDMFVDDLRAQKEIQSKVRIKPSQCVTCTRRKSHYYEAVLQIRADRRDLTEEEMEAVYRYVNQRVDSAPDAFISEEEEMHGGWDFHMSPKALARNISKELALMYGAQESSSAKLIGMKEGQELYRVTHSVRLPLYKVGDVINHKGVLYQITNMATTVTVSEVEASAIANSSRIARFFSKSFCPRSSSYGFSSKPSNCNATTMFLSARSRSKSLRRSSSSPFVEILTRTISGRERASSTNSSTCG